MSVWEKLENTFYVRSSPNEYVIQYIKIDHPRGNVTEPVYLMPPLVSYEEFLKPKRGKHKLP